AIMAELGHRVHFLHLRNVKRESDALKGSFHEAEHLEGDTDMVALIATVLAEEQRRKAEGRTDWQIPMRPDHGQDILDDLNRTARLSNGRPHERPGRTRRHHPDAGPCRRAVRVLAGPAAFPPQGVVSRSHAGLLASASVTDRAGIAQW